MLTTRRPTGADAWLAVVWAGLMAILVYGLFFTRP